MKKRVFISSTFSDLVSLREAVEKAIRQLGAIDISMENFGARDERPKEECLRLIREESDVYIGIFAYRYGYIPEGDETSITEAEYREASSSGIPRLIYLVDERIPWVPSNIERGLGESKLHKLKGELRANHICGVFSTEDDLAAKVAADLGRHFSTEEAREQRYRDIASIDLDREYRLIQDLRSGDKYNIKRSIVALLRSDSPWLVDALNRFVVGQDQELADVALSALREIPGSNSAAAIADGLKSEFPRIRSWAAFTIGEMALLGRRDDALSEIDTLIEALENLSEDIRTMDEIVHSLGKIGGPKAFDTLINVLKCDSMPAQLKAKALHSPGRFWTSIEFDRRPDSTLYNRFVNTAIPIIESWPIELCKSVQRSSIFQYIRGPLNDAVKSRSEER